MSDFSLITWEWRGDALWLHHKAGGNKVANAYERALVEEVESLRADLRDKLAAANVEILAFRAQLAKARADVIEEREACVKVAENWIEVYGATNPTYISPQDWAVDAIRDIIDHIHARSLAHGGGDG